MTARGRRTHRSISDERRACCGDRHLGAACTEDRSLDDPFPPELLLEGYPPPIAELAQGLRRIVRAAVQDATERVRIGWQLIGYDVPRGRRSAFFAWIWPQVEHVHLGYPDGILVDDPDEVLQGRGITKRARWFTLREPSELLDERLTAFTVAAADVARLSRAELALRRLERAEPSG